MRHSLSSLLFFFGLFLTAGESTAMELHTFDFSGNDAQLFATLDGLNAGSHTSVGIADEVSLNAMQGVPGASHSQPVILRLSTTNVVIVTFTLVFTAN